MKNPDVKIIFEKKIINESELVSLVSDFKKLLIPSELNFTTQSSLQPFINSNVLLLSGDLGAGKTTFVRYLCESLGIYSSQSPTYAIHQKYVANQKSNHNLIKNLIHNPSDIAIHKSEYFHDQINDQANDQIIIHHFDLYRIQDASELMSTGFWDLIYQKDFLFLIEWYEKINDPEWILSLVQTKNIFGLKIKKSSEDRIFQFFKIS